MSTNRRSALLVSTVIALTLVVGVLALIFLPSADADNRIDTTAPESSSDVALWEREVSRLVNDNRSTYGDQEINPASLGGCAREIERSLGNYSKRGNEDYRSTIQASVATSIATGKVTAQLQRIFVNTYGSVVSAGKNLDRVLNHARFNQCHADYVRDNQQYFMLVGYLSQPGVVLDDNLSFRGILNSQAVGTPALQQLQLIASLTSASQPTLLGLTLRLDYGCNTYEFSAFKPCSLDG